MFPEVFFPSEAVRGRQRKINVVSGSFFRDVQVLAEPSGRHGLSGGPAADGHSWLVRASSDPAPSGTYGDSTRRTSGRIYREHSGIRTHLTQFHDSVTTRYNYAFGKEHPFLPSNAMTANGQFVSPRSVPTAEYCGTATRRPTTSGVSLFTPTVFRQPWYLKNVNHADRREGRSVLTALRRLS